MTYEDSVVLVTGGTGSIGMVLARELLNRGTKEIRLLSNDENGLFEAKQILGSNSNVQFVFGDVRDPRSMASATRNCNLVFHAAALKHVNFCEDNPYEAVTTNVIGTQNAIDAALESGVERFIYISTDKAVNPVSTMGATKLLGEKITIDAAMRKKRAICACIRFGNILGSRGSVLRVFERQMIDGGPITVTNPDMTRFVMLAKEAKDLVLNVAATAESGDTFVLKMKAVRIGDFAQVSRAFFSKKYGVDERRISIRHIGMMRAEKVHEELMTSTERAKAVERENYFVIKPGNAPQAPRTNSLVPYSSNSVVLSSKEIYSLLRKWDSGSRDSEPSDGSTLTERKVGG